MASTYEIKRGQFGDYLPAPAEPITRLYEENAGQPYTGAIAMGPYADGQYHVYGPRESLLTLKYDLEKKRYE